MSRNNLSARGLVRRYGGLTAVEDVNMDVPSGQITGLIGPNGAGKSTLFSLLTGVEQPDEGKVLLGQRNITRMSPDARSRRGLVQTFQVPSLFPSLTVADNLLVAAENRRRDYAGDLLGFRARGRTGALQIVDDVLASLQLEDIRESIAGTLPTGALRLVEFARALCARPDVLLLDEPASGLDAAETERFSALVRRIADDGVAILLVDHDVDLVFKVVDRVYAMVGGRVVAEGAPAAVRADPTVQSVYLAQGPLTSKNTGASPAGGPSGGGPPADSPPTGGPPAVAVSSGELR
ncbi:branched-chain amino acid transport system ATP-binding protein [Parafrankia irregularis]|uniref:Branched-chain amino acid transport system ATP-binding protein n=1 Tax=Parafrankia irregularis TaxID=795642 RepID=A0A0S4QRX7_9ACTN|nr:MULTISPECIES: ABC transporter ATP-binding protein [Parafrankia]MBE3202685.1 ABC transporter ATP-binding protein [Parafrankia sp. CH37]CUU57871.1 branched-chain amino acid transport system ATP-binding protein [Parafrankia irregularis]